ncbi:MAG TPA: 4a-hydroxytetrahydrobiopterin dehydratase [Actinobacteria bacterium]|jgi:4a-hydroxytetrahydrobiopterin dehydratase|nr:4a-hydroxytetrahydrobiopterin dehydratase [Actinomycetota bacterium]
MTTPPLASDAMIASFCSAHAQWIQEGPSLVSTTTARTFMDAIALVQVVAVVAERMDHHPDIDIRWRTVTFRLSTHSAGGITGLDFALAEEIDSLVASS